MDWLRTWDWAVPVERHGKALCRITMGLFAMAGLVNGAVIETLPRRVHLAILHTLRPAEAALRRLIVLALRAEGEIALTRTRTAKTRRKKGTGRGTGRKSSPAPAFSLFDTRINVDPKHRNTPGYGPRIRAFDGLDDPAHIRKTPMPDDEVSALRLCRRLLALQAALDDLPAQAARLKRVLARTTRRWPQPMRRGRPPGYRAKGREPIDEILEDCQIQAIWALTPPEPG